MSKLVFKNIDFSFQTKILENLTTWEERILESIKAVNETETEFTKFGNFVEKYSLNNTGQKDKSKWHDTYNPVSIATKIVKNLIIKDPYSVSNLSTLEDSLDDLKTSSENKLNKLIANLQNKEIDTLNTLLVYLNPEVNDSSDYKAEEDVGRYTNTVKDWIQLDAFQMLYR